MAKKPRPEPHTQGSMGEIYRWFFGALLQKCKPQRMEINEFLEDTVFDFKNRDITRYVAKNDFVLPGLYRVAGNMKIQGIGYREVKAATELYVRKDARNPNAIDVEFFGGQGGKDQVFELDESQWGWVLLNLEEQEKERKK